jgi:hypothetical protein
MRIGIPQAIGLPLSEQSPNMSAITVAKGQFKMDDTFTINVLSSAKKVYFENYNYNSLKINRMYFEVLRLNEMRYGEIPIV